MQKFAHHARAPSWADSFAATPLGRHIVPQRFLTRASNGQCVLVRSSCRSPASILQQRRRNTCDSDIVGHRPRVSFAIAAKSDTRSGLCQLQGRKGEPLARGLPVFHDKTTTGIIESHQLTLDSESNAFAMFDSMIGTGQGVRTRRSRAGRECTQRAEEGGNSNATETSVTVAPRCRPAAGRVN